MSKINKFVVMTQNNQERQDLVQFVAASEKILALTPDHDKWQLMVFDGQILAPQGITAGLHAVQNGGYERYNNISELFKKYGR